MNETAKPGHAPLPNLFVIGAAKCGTTSLWLYLDAHPEIAMSRMKEPAFFLDADYLDRLGWYESLFVAAPVVGEASTLYTVDPVYPGVPERIRSLVEEPKLIYMVRDPVERAISHFIEHVAQGLESRSATEALGDPDESRNLYVAGSRYASQVKRYLESFPATSLLIFEQSELRRSPAETLRRVYEFLGVDEAFQPPRPDVQVRRSDQRREFTGLGARLQHTRARHLAERWISRLPPGAAIKAIGALKRPFSSPIGRPELEPELLASLRQQFRPEAEWLREFAGEPFESWSC